MSKFQKTLERFRRNPKNVRFEELRDLLEKFGFMMKPGRGSHMVFRKEGVQPITIPKREPFLLCKYVKHALKRLDEISDDEDD